MDDFSESKGLLDYNVQSVRLPVFGMTCQSCVKNIENTIGTKRGIINIKVELNEKCAYIEYDPAETDPKKIAWDIDDMGFECPYKENEELLVKDNEPITMETKILIEGMTCQSCVKNIESNISIKSGIISIKVSLADKCAMVSYNKLLITPNDIADMIDDMGFGAQVADSCQQPYNKTDNKTKSGKYLFILLT